MTSDKRYCEYCYGTHLLVIGDDGSLIVCGNCDAGLVPLSLIGPLNDKLTLGDIYDMHMTCIEARFHVAHCRLCAENTAPAGVQR